MNRSPVVIRNCMLSFVYAQIWLLIFYNYKAVNLWAVAVYNMYMYMYMYVYTYILYKKLITLTKIGG